jgi:hypothetical protein
MYVVNIYQSGGENEFPPIHASTSAQHALEAARTAMSNDPTIDRVIIHEIVCNSYYRKKSFSSKNKAFRAVKDNDGKWHEVMGDLFLLALPIPA